MTGKNKKWIVSIGAVLITAALLGLGQPPILPESKMFNVHPMEEMDLGCLAHCLRAAGPDSATVPAVLMLFVGILFSGLISLNIQAFADPQVFRSTKVFWQFDRRKNNMVARE